MRRVELVVRGIVQGVFYRANAVAAAQRLGLSGWVRNRDDGAVELVAEGPDAACEAMVTWCRRGPVGARVTDVDVKWTAAQGEKGFRVER